MPAFVTVANFVFGYAVYVLERQAQPDVFDLWGSIFVVTQVLLTGPLVPAAAELNSAVLLQAGHRIRTTTTIL